MTGQSKGYGMVRYSCSQAAAQARHLLDNRQVNGTKIQVKIDEQIDKVCERPSQTQVLTKIVR